MAVAETRGARRAAMRSRMPLGDFLVAYLKRAGVTHLFGLPGDLVLGLFDRFGRAVAVSDLDLLVGVVSDDDNGTNSGSAYVFPAPEPSDRALPALALATLASLARLRSVSRPPRARPR